MARFVNAEEAIYTAAGNHSVNWDKDSIEIMLGSAGFRDVKLERVDYTIDRAVTNSDLEQWFGGGPGSSSFAKAAHNSLSEVEIAEIIALCRRKLSGKTVSWRKTYLFVSARK